MTPAALYPTAPCAVFRDGRYVNATVTAMDGPGRLLDLRLVTGERLRDVPWRDIKARRP